MKGYLVLENGTVFQGEAFGAPRGNVGEVVFNTSMTGYQEILTDPSYAGQIVVMTYPLVGNYGINPEDFESRQPFVRGFVVKELCMDPSHWQANQSLSEYLARNEIPGLYGIDTRALTRHLRVKGTLRGVLATANEGPAEADQKLEERGGILALDGQWRIPHLSPSLRRWLTELQRQARAFVLSRPVLEVTTPTAYHLEPEDGRRRKPRVVVVDFGVKRSILRIMTNLGYPVTVVPATVTAEEILALDPAGVLLSNGPGDPQDVSEGVAIARTLITAGVPLFGICLGHQIIGLALGGKSVKLKFGHRGANHPVKDCFTGRIYITSHNHGYALEESSLPPEVVVTHRSLNDNTVEGIMHTQRPVWSVQYHPEGSPGPQESRYLLERFLTELDRKK
ncbi:glutamine-hydrolyzing carbamoyl-phosphate synthase small subunit [Brockia lithotrophica]|uniref:Carbamoyl phosphate synthase small chain n=1 Tax=Brockia lithotrophica TaxID=933949 RepID=A0A660KSS1_9BACL|nr:glutamine-hydrolyzing carbamoyl-phosphate synthase small subunit [Brockia lithotrophica]RKQ83530.1 carbamoyl-phosphate synthase small subunit [Brockia lithotrophica]